MQSFKEYLNEDKTEIINEAREISPAKMQKATAKFIEQMEAFKEMVDTYDDQSATSEGKKPEIPSSVVKKIDSGGKEFYAFHDYVRKMLR